jgi:hypothetical protein
MRRIEVQSQPREEIHKTLSQPIKTGWCFMHKTSATQEV